MVIRQSSRVRCRSALVAALWLASLVLGFSIPANADPKMDVIVLKNGDQIIIGYKFQACSFPSARVPY